MLDLLKPASYLLIYYLLIYFNFYYLLQFQGGKLALNV